MDDTSQITFEQRYISGLLKVNPQEKRSVVNEDTKCKRYKIGRLAERERENCPIPNNPYSFCGCRAQWKKMKEEEGNAGVVLDIFQTSMTSIRQWRWFTETSFVSSICWSYLVKYQKLLVNANPEMSSAHTGIIGKVQQIISHLCIFSV